MMVHHDIEAFIPARYASSRFPGKPLAPILGLPLVVRVWQQVAQALPPSSVHVATDDDRIVEVCKQYGISTVMTSDAHPTGTDRVAEAAQDSSAAIILNVQGDEPLIQPEDVTAAIEAKRAWPDHVVCTMAPIEDPKDLESPNVPKVVVDERDRMVYVSRAPVPYGRKSGVDVVSQRQVCIYAFSPSQLKRFGSLGRRGTVEAIEDIEILRCLDLDIPVKMVQVRGTPAAVDVPGDVARVEAYLRALGRA